MYLSKMNNCLTKYLKSNLRSNRKPSLHQFPPINPLNNLSNRIYNNPHFLPTRMPRKRRRSSIFCLTLIPILQRPTCPIGRLLRPGRKSFHITIPIFSPRWYSRAKKRPKRSSIFSIKRIRIFTVMGKECLNGLIKMCLSRWFTNKI